MGARVIDGVAIAEKVKAQVAEAVAAMKPRVPKLVALMVGDNPGARAYAKSQGKACEEVGIAYELRELPETISEADLIREITALNSDPEVTAVLLTMPVPPHLDGRAAQRLIDPLKDADGVHPVNLGGVVQGRRQLAPCTALAVMEILESAEVPLKGAEVVMVGHSEIVGKPTALLLLEQLATVTVCHIGTVDLAAHTRRAEILIVAVGKPGLITADMVRPGAVVVDVGINRVMDPETGKSRIVGDVDYGPVSEIASAITPVPGGVGAVTTAMLLRNVVEAATLQETLKRI
jgi:methylenetetrahydrofolate dehydrogenase (NADP+)/methenyltetrahydrofolate cyclohydrolase